MPAPGASRCTSPALRTYANVASHRLPAAGTRCAGPARAAGGSCIRTAFDAHCDMRPAVRAHSASIGDASPPQSKRDELLAGGPRNSEPHLLHREGQARSPTTSVRNAGICGVSR